MSNAFGKSINRSTNPSGACQSLLWPCCVRLLDQWTEEAGRNTVMGVFNTCAFAGGIAANFVSVGILTAAGWRYVFPVASCYVALMGVLVFFTCHEKTAAAATKKELEVESLSSLKADGEESKTLLDSVSAAPPPPPSAPLSWRELWSKPGFADICICMLCLKVTR